MKCLGLSMEPRGVQARDFAGGALRKISRWIYMVN